MRLEWDKYFMALAKLAALRSGCNSRPTGAVIVKNQRVIATGYNGTICGQPQCTDKDSKFCLRRSVRQDDKGENKYVDCPSIHAEQNAINQIAKYGGTPLIGASIYCTLSPCRFCFDNILSVGIKNIYYELEYKSDDPERDKYWMKRVVESGATIKQILLSRDEEILIRNTFLFYTSERRL